MTFVTTVARRVSVTAARALAKAGFTRVFVPPLARAIFAHSEPWLHPNPPQYTLLALTPERFRGDLEILQSSGIVRILRMPPRWLGGLLTFFLEKEVLGLIDLPRSFFQDDDTNQGPQSRQKYRGFLTALLPRLYRRLGVDCVIGAAIWYTQDFDWGAVSEQTGTPFIVLHLENLATAPGQIRRLVSNASTVGKFSGSCIIVHNEICRNAFIEGGFIDADRIQALGALRMDEFLERIEKARAQNKGASRKKVTLFSFHRGYGLWGLTSSWPTEQEDGLTQFFTSVHGSFGELAVEFPEVDFVIKPKWGGQWIPEIEKVLQQHNIEIASQENLEILLDANAQELILESDIVCGYGSTTLLEAGIANKTVIVPLFHEITRPEYREFIHFRDELDMFIVPDTPEEFKNEIRKALASGEVDQERLALCCRAFERHVSSLDGGTLDKYLSVIGSTIDQRNGAKGN